MEPILAGNSAIGPFATYQPPLPQQQLQAVNRQNDLKTGVSYAHQSPAKEQPVF